MSLSIRTRRLAALFTALALVALSAGIASAHEERDVAGYRVEVGFMDEPVYVGDRTGLELIVHKGDAPVEGLESTVKAVVTKDAASRDLVLAPIEDTPGIYHAVFIPTVAGPYTFHLTGTIEGNAIDETFTSSPQGFDEVQESSAGQFPVQFPSQAELVADTQAAKDASSQMTLALALGGAGLLVGIVALGLAVAGRRKPA